MISKAWEYFRIGGLLHNVLAQRSVHRTAGTQRFFRHFAWLEVGSIKAALPRLAHQRVTQAVGQLLADL